MTDSVLPLLIFDGNCSAHHLAAIFNATGIAEAHSLGGDYGFVPAFRNERTRYLSEEEAFNLIVNAKKRGRAIYQVSQATQFREQNIFSFTNLVHEIIRFPWIQFYTFNPEQFSKQFKSTISVKKIYSLDIDTIRQCQKKTETAFDFAGFVEEEGQRQVLFHTWAHIGGHLTSLLFELIAAKIPSILPAAIQYWSPMIRFNEGLNFVTDHPISDEVIHELGFHWPDNYRIYCQMLSLGKAGEWSELRARAVEFYNLFRADSQYWYWIARAGDALNDDGLTERGVTRFCEMSPGYGRSWVLRYNFWKKKGDAGRIEQTIAEAGAFFRGQRIYSNLMAWIEIDRKNLKAAEHFATDYLRRTPDRTDAIMPLLKLKLSQGKSDDAARLALEYARGRRESDYEALLANYQVFRPALHFDEVQIRQVLVSQ